MLRSRVPLRATIRFAAGQFRPGPKKRLEYLAGLYYVNPCPFDPS